MAGAVKIDRRETVATLTLCRGKVNAIDWPLIRELKSALHSLQSDSEVRAVILTGSGPFFSFGFDVPKLFPYSRTRFRGFVTDFDKLLVDLFLFPKPVVAAINGHAIAGGCMLALACDYRIMVDGKAKISLNEITFASTIFASPTEMLRAAVGTSAASEILFHGRMYTAGAAKEIRLIDEVCGERELMERAQRIAREMGTKAPAAFASVKKLLREPIVAALRGRRAESIRDFVTVWYSKPTRKALEHIRIH